MLRAAEGFVEIAEVNPPLLPDMSHTQLGGRWDHVLVTDNAFGRVRVSPYAYAARITHDVPEVRPTVVVSTRDRNVLAIESEVRGAIGNGVESFLVVVGDTLPEVDHWANHYEIVEHLLALQECLPAFEVGMTTRFRGWQFRRRTAIGAQFLVAGPVLDPATVASNVARLELDAGDPPIFIGVIPPFSPTWITRLEEHGALPATTGLKERVAALPNGERRRYAWRVAAETADRCREAGAAGVVLMGLKFSTLVGEAWSAWHGSRAGVATVETPDAHH